MKTEMKKLLLALLIVIGFTSCSNDNEETKQANERTIFKLSLTNDTDTVADSSKVNLAKVTLAKIEYSIVEKDSHPIIAVIKEADLIMAGDSIKSTSIDNRILNFKSGSTLTIHSVKLFDGSDEHIGNSPITAPDAFIITSYEGSATMERLYTTIGIQE